MSYMALAFDTLKYANKLKTAGIPEQQAEVQAEAMAELVTEKLATKQDLHVLEERMTAKVSELETRMTTKVNELEMRMTAKIDGLDMKLGFLESRITIKLGGMVAASMGTLVILLKLFNL